MPLVSQTINSFKGGVSQQPDIIRFPDQVTEMINGFPNEVEGLQKRPPTLHVGSYNLPQNVKNKYHLINRDDKEQYILELGKDAFRVFGLDGSSRECYFQDDSAKNYLNCEDPERELRAVTVADYTFVVNTTKTVDNVTGESPNGRADCALVYIKNAQYAKTYAIYINGEYICGVITPDGGESRQAVETTTAFIARALYSLLTTGKKPDGNNPDVGGTYNDLLNQVGGRKNMGYSRSGAGISNYNVDLVGDSVIVIQSKAGWVPPNILVKDGFGNQNAIAYMGKVSAVNKLPPIAPPDYIMQVSGEKNSEDDDFYVKWDDHHKVWKETLAPRIPYQIPAGNMPHAIVREADGRFQMKRLPWVDRGAGNLDTNPDPSFIGRKINDIFFYRNRLGMIADESIILSSTNDFFNFWFKSSAEITDTDPIDVSVSSNKVAILTHAVPFARELMLFSKEGQFVLSSDGVLTPKSVKCDQITAFNYDTFVQPISVGPSIFFVDTRVNYASVMRYYSLQDVADLKDAEDVTAHIPSYIPKGVFKLSGTTSEGVVLATNKASHDTLYGYKFILLNGVSEQQAWFKWKFGGNLPNGNSAIEIVFADFIGSELYVLFKTQTKLFLEKLLITGNVVDIENEPYRLFMDRKVKWTIPQDAQYNDYDDETSFDLANVYGAPLTARNEKYYVVDPEGYVEEIDVSESSVAVLRGDRRGSTVFIGRQFTFCTELSQQVIKQSTETGGVISEVEGRLQLRYFWFNHGESGVYDCYVDNNLKDKHFHYRYTGRDLGVSSTFLGANRLFTGKFKFPVQDNSDEVRITVCSDNTQPLNIISGGWEGYYIRRNNKV